MGRCARASGDAGGELPMPAVVFIFALYPKITGKLVPARIHVVCEQAAKMYDADLANIYSVN